MIATNNEKDLSRNISRLGKSRKERYLNIPTQNAEMHKIYKEFFEYFVNLKPIEDNVKNFIMNIIKSNNKSLEFKKGLIGVLNNEYVVVFMNVAGLDLACIQITYNDEERILFRNFLDKCNSYPTNMDAFLILSLNLLKNKQMASLIKNEQTVGRVYINYPLQDYIVDKGFIRYTTDSLSKIACKSGIDATFNAINRGVSIKEIEDVFPEDPEARLFAREFTEEEVTQINALEYGISESV